ncbi:DUF1190 domain-containing protein [Pseudomonas piscis]|uniref:DUF1190 domain-containing protein n=1 Tax=Pseudomonas piscis TaxID=2614538 RepID=A0ABY9NHY5_9PSED|nr:DUF1190 domain-containing protein [Pseudomonas piscis]WMN17323.1 DUF1190 domain-containing protein [Pseudomonas piscis]
MKRSRSVRLVLLGSVPFALAACDGQPQATRVVRQVQHFSTPEECAQAQVPMDICLDARHDAWAYGQEDGPRYWDLKRCEADFLPGACTISSDGRAYVPMFYGFALTTDRTVPVTPEDEQQAATDSSSSSSSSTGSSSGSSSFSGGGGHGSSSSGSSFWRWIGLDSTPEPRYFTEGLYKERDAQGGERLSTLAQQVEGGKSFPGASSGRFAISSPEHFTSTGSSFSGAHEVVSRGGFGSSSSSGHSSWGFGS